SAHGSLSVVCFLASVELTTLAIGTARLGRISLFGRGKSTRIVLSSMTTTWSADFISLAPIWIAGKPPTATARSNDHFTSLAVTGVPSWNFASLRGGKVAG